MSATIPDLETVSAEEEQSPEERQKESKGLRAALYGMLASIVLVALLVVPPGAPLRNPATGSIVEDSPFIDSLIFIITVVFLVAGICYGLAAKTLSSSTDVINGVTETFAGLSGLIFMLLLYVLFLVIGFARHRFQSVVVTSTTAVVLALVLGLSMKFGFATH